MRKKKSINLLTPNSEALLLPQSFINLRYYAIFKVRNFKSLFYFCKKLPLALDCRQSKYYL